jgi:hypothetical protein
LHVGSDGAVDDRAKLPVADFEMQLRGRISWIATIAFPGGWVGMEYQDHCWPGKKKVRGSKRLATVLRRRSQRIPLVQAFDLEDFRVV